jgi:hypothetical protein
VYGHDKISFMEFQCMYSRWIKRLNADLSMFEIESNDFFEADTRGLYFIPLRYVESDNARSLSLDPRNSN